MIFKIRFLILFYDFKNKTVILNFLKNEGVEEKNCSKYEIY